VSYGNDVSCCIRSIGKEITMEILIVPLWFVIGCLIGTIILRAAAQWVQKMDVPFRIAFVTILVSGIVNILMGINCIGAVIFNSGSGPQTQDIETLARILIWPVGFLIQSGFVYLFLKIPFGRACLISLSMIGIGLGIFLIAVLPFILYYSD
jgi:hypothetical protein